MSVKLWSVYACEFHFVSNDQTAGTAHSCTINHDRVHADNCRDLQFLCKETDKFHHDHWTDCNTYIIFVSIIYKFFDHCCNHSGMSVGPIICTWVIVTRYSFHSIFKDQHIFCLCSDNNICCYAVFM